MTLLAHVPAQPPAPVDYLVLKNGAVLTGRVTQEGETWVLRSLTSSGESRYSAKMVAKVCATPHDVYELFKRSIVPDEVNDRCRLASLCLKYGLMSEAKLEIEAALKLDRQCVEARTLLKQWTAKQDESAKVAQDVPALPMPTVPAITPVSLEEWFIAKSPPMMQDYTQRIQPLLSVGCGTGACHGVAEGKRAFVLKKVLAGIQPSAIITRTNLERVLALVDKQNPDASELLKKAGQPHANVKIWPVNTEQQAALRQWAWYVTGKLDVAQQQALEAQNNSKKSSDQFASGSTLSGTPPATKQADNGTGSKLPAIPGMSGAAIQQTGGVTPPSTQDKESGVGAAIPASSPSGLPVIPGVSGKAQNGTLPPASKQETPSTGPRTQIDMKDKPEFRDYAKRLGQVDPVAPPKDGVPQQMRIVNGGNYRVETPPVPELPEEVRNYLKRQDEAKLNEAKNKNNDKDGTVNPASFLWMGTIVNAPPK
ncbi:MAG TPA: hypothetical protein PLN21_13875 [Gemmatales bacterium]|nr:hypothetical protein [Gemmatales bacterium]